MMTGFRPYSEFPIFDDADIQQRSADFLQHMRTRRTVRQFSDRSVSAHVVNNCLSVALSAPSGANQQPWTFVVVKDPMVRQRLRTAAEDEEQQFYEHRAPQQWLDAVQPLGTDASKPFLESAPVLIAVFARTWQPLPNGGKGKHYYVSESVGIATGFLIAALHYAGLATLTHTPSPMQFLNRILDRPDHERPFLLVVAGYPADNCTVPEIKRRDFDDVVNVL